MASPSSSTSTTTASALPTWTSGDSTAGAEVQGGGIYFYPSSGRASGGHTQLGFLVDDLEAEVGALRQKRATFESCDMPRFDAATSIASFPGLRSAWFKDTEGNLLGMVQMTDDS